MSKKLIKIITSKNQLLFNFFKVKQDDQDKDKNIMKIKIIILFKNI